MNDTPKLIESPRQSTASIRLKIPRADIQKVMEPAIRELMSTISAQGIVPAGPLLSYHFSIDPEIFDFEVSIPVSTPVTPTGRVINSELPEATVLRMIYRGPYENLGQAWGEFQAWIGRNGYQKSAGLWERYVSGPESSPDPAQWCTELNQTVQAG